MTDMASRQQVAEFILRFTIKLISLILSRNKNLRKNMCFQDNNGFFYERYMLGKLIFYYVLNDARNLTL